MKRPLLALSATCLWLRPALVPRLPSPSLLRLWLAPAPRRGCRGLSRGGRGGRHAHSEGFDIYGRPVERGEAVGTSVSEEDQCEPVVKVYCVHARQAPVSPWSNKHHDESTGSGFAIEHQGQRLILTNAHVVSDAAYVEVRKAGDAEKFTATRAKVSHQCDLALLQVESDAFWQGVQPLHFGGMPCLQDEVSVMGYPEGGEGVAVTQGVVSRIEIQTYAHSGVSLLAVQIDAAINPGNSGGPALDEEGNVIGVAFQNQQNSQNIGYLVPVPTIKHFLEDTDPANPRRCSGFCSIGIFWQELQNCQLRSYIGLPPNRSGVLVRGTLPLAPAAKLLRRGDVIMALEGQRIANDATFAVGKQERLSFQHLLHLKFPGEQVELLLLRDGEEVNVTVPVQPMSRLVPATTDDEPSPYFVYGGLVFQPLSKPYLEAWGDDWRSAAPHRLVALALSGTRTLPDEQVVILSRCFPSERTAGYSDLVDSRVVAVNGVSIVNLSQMYTLIQRLHTEQPFVVFELDCTGPNALVSVNTATAEEVCKEVMQIYRIPAVASPDLLAAHADSSK